MDHLRVVVGKVRRTFGLVRETIADHAARKQIALTVLVFESGDPRTVGEARVLASEPHLVVIGRFEVARVLDVRTHERAPLHDFIGRHVRHSVDEEVRGNYLCLVPLIDQLRKRRTKSD